jgi:hypothetical protein
MWAVGSGKGYGHVYVERSIAGDVAEHHVHVAAYVHRIFHFFISDDAPIHRIIFASSLSIRARMSNISVVLSAFRALKASGVGRNASSSFIPKESYCMLPLP